jgi:hypothetical protein
MSNKDFYAEVSQHLSKVMKKYLKEDEDLTKNLSHKIEKETMQKVVCYTSNNEERRQAHRFIKQQLTQIQNRQIKEKLLEK